MKMAPTCRRLHQQCRNTHFLALDGNERSIQPERNPGFSQHHRLHQSKFGMIDWCARRRVARVVANMARRGADIAQPLHQPLAETSDNLVAVHIVKARAVFEKLPGKRAADMATRFQKNSARSLLRSRDCCRDGSYHDDVHRIIRWA
jgi:hypothetical protein